MFIALPAPHASSVSIDVSVRQAPLSTRSRYAASNWPLVSGPAAQPPAQMIPVARVPEGSTAVAASVVHGGVAGAADVLELAEPDGVLDDVLVLSVDAEPCASLDDEQAVTARTARPAVARRATRWAGRVTAVADTVDSCSPVDRPTRSVAAVSTAARRGRGTFLPRVVRRWRADRRTLTARNGVAVPLTCRFGRTLRRTPVTALPSVTVDES
jgi:hypothetical protein